MSSGDATTNQFILAQTYGLIYVNKAFFIDTSVVDELDVIVSFTSIPTIDQIMNETDFGGLKYYDSCIAFSINPDNKVVYKNQLFYEDIDITPSSSNFAVGIYLKNIDIFHSVIPSVSFLNKYRKYTLLTSGSDSVLDNGWSIFNFLETDQTTPTPLGRLMGGCGGTSRFNVTNEPFQRLVFKSRYNAFKDQYQFYAWSNGLGTDTSRINNDWYRLAKTNYRGVYWDIVYRIANAPNPIFSINSIPTGKTFIAGPEQYIDDANLDNGLTINPDKKTFGLTSANLGWDCNLCMFNTDEWLNVHDNCYNSTRFTGYLIQPSVTSILKSLLNSDKFKVLNVYLCTNKVSDSSFLNPTKFKATNEFLKRNLSTFTCNDNVLRFCQGQNLIDSKCKTYCQNNNCYSAVTSYCSSLGDSALSDYNRTICGCNMNTDFVQKSYSTYVDDLSRRRLAIPTCDQVKQLIFPPCVTSSYGGAYNTTNKKAPPCNSNIVNCVSLIDINNQGNITGNVTANVNAECQSVINQVTGGVTTCISRTDCKDTNFPICDSGSGKCVQCKINGDCSGYPLASICDSNNTCVECKTNTDCTGAKPLCSNGKCSECIQNTDCKDGKVCKEGVCKFECEKDYDCQNGKVCVDNMCVVSNPAKPAKNTIIYVGAGSLILIILLVVVIKLLKK